jgi:hypothetical protein
MVFFDHQMSASMVFWIVIGVISIASFFFRYRESVHRNKTLQMLAEKGQPIPPELFRDEGYRYRGRRGGVRQGITLMAIGIAIFIFLSGMMGGFVNGFHVGPGWLPLVGIFPFMLGLAALLGALVDRRDPPDSKT